MKKLELNEEEVKSLQTYFDNTMINMTSMIKKVGLKEVKKFESVLKKIYEDQ